MRALKKVFYALTDSLRELMMVTELALPNFRRRGTTPEIPVIASLTTYPPRIGLAWLAIESLLRQSVRPRKLILVLSEDEFPQKIVPRRIQQQSRRGLEILWVARNGRSYDKLIPVRQRYPGETIVTFDDDKFFPRTLLEELYLASVQNPGSVIGSRGWIIPSDGTEIHYGANWVRATPGARGRNLFTPGGNGCLYPPSSLDSTCENLDLALAICPTADDIWFWGAIQKTQSNLVCLGLPAHRPVKALTSTTALSDINRHSNDSQLQKILSFISPGSCDINLAGKDGAPND